MTRVIYIKGDNFGYFKSIDKAYFYGSFELITTADIKKAKKYFDNDDTYIKDITRILEANNLEYEIRVLQKEDVCKQKEYSNNHS